MSQGIKCILDGNRGIYVPYAFAGDFSEWQGINKEDIDICLSGPEHEWYWDAWNTILDNAFFIDKNSNKWFLYQDGDLFAVCNELLTDEEYAEFYGEERELVEIENDQAQI